MRKMAGIALRSPCPRGAGGTNGARFHPPPHSFRRLWIGTAQRVTSVLFRRSELTLAHRRVGRAVLCPPRLPTRVTLGPGRRARSVAPYLTAIHRGRQPILGSINPDPGILYPPECIRSALATEAGVKTKRSACTKNPQVGRAVLGPPRLPTRAFGFTTAARTERPTCPIVTKNCYIGGRTC